MPHEPRAIPVCRWAQDADGNWWSECNEGFVLNDGTPADNGMSYCCYCGKVLFVDLPYSASLGEGDG